MEIGNDGGLSLVSQLSKNILDAQTVAESSGLSALATVKTEALAGNTGKTNLLENNFVMNASEPSKYIQSAMIGFQVKSEFGAKMQGIVDNYQHQLGSVDEDGYAQRALAGKKAARATEALVEREVTETETARLEKERQEFEEAAEKTAAQEATGNTGSTLEGAVAGDTEAVASSQDPSGPQDDGTATVQGTAVQSEPEDAAQGQSPVVASSADAAAQQDTDTATARSGRDGSEHPSVDMVV